MEYVVLGNLTNNTIVDNENSSNKYTNQLLLNYSPISDRKCKLGCNPFVATMGFYTEHGEVTIRLEEMGTNILITQSEQGFIEEKLKWHQLGTREEIMIALVDEKISNTYERIAVFQKQFSELERKIYKSISNKDIEKVVIKRSEMTAIGEEILNIQEMFKYITAHESINQSTKYKAFIDKIDGRLKNIEKHYSLVNNTIQQEISTFGSIVHGNMLHLSVLVAVMALVIVIILLVIEYIVNKTIMVSVINCTAVLIALIVLAILKNNHTFKH